MSAVFTDAGSVRDIAEDLIRLYHPRIPNHRVRLVYLFSDQKPEVKGKRVFGVLKIVRNLNAYLAEKPEDDYELPAFVCTKCRAWKLAAELAELKVNNDVFEMCQVCHDETSGWDWGDNGNIAKMVNWREMARQKRDGGFDPGAPNAFFVMVVYKTMYDFVGEKSRRGHVNHLLCHAGVTTDKHGETKLYDRPHDIEDFQANVEVFGTDWHGDLERFAVEAAKQKGVQLSLTNFDDDPGVPADEEDGKANGRRHARRRVTTETPDAAPDLATAA